MTEMHLVPEQDPLVLIEAVQRDVEDLQKEHTELRNYVLGPEGDITKGLVWMNTMQGKMLIDLQQLLTAQATTLERQRDSLDRHALDVAIHAQRGSANWNWSRLVYGIAQTATAQLVVLLVIAVLGVMIFGLQAKHILGPGTP